MDKYREDPRISISELNTLLKSPEQFRYEKLEGNKREETPSMILGTLVHSMILEPEKFDDEYYVSDGKVPTGKYAEMMSQICENYPTISDVPINDETVIMTFALQAGIDHKKDTVVKNFMSDKYMGYLKSLFDGKGKKIISPEVHGAAMKMVDAVKQHPVASSYIFDTQLRDDVKIYFEKEVYWIVDGVEVKSKLDILIVNPVEKLVLVIDLKTGRAQNVQMFKGSCIKYRYDNQITFYTDAATSFVSNELGMTDFTVSHLFVTVANAAPYEVLCVEFDSATIEKARESYLSAIQEFKWRMKENKWYSEESYEGNVNELSLVE